MEEEGNDLPSSLKNILVTVWCNRPEHDVRGGKLTTTIKTDRAKIGCAALEVLRNLMSQEREISTGFKQTEGFGLIEARKTETSPKMEVG